MQLTFELLPEAVSRLFDKLENIERLLQQKTYKPQTEQDNVMVIKEAAEFLHLSLPTIYALVSNRKIPFMKKGKRLYFSTQKLTAWLHESKRECIL